MVVFQKPNPPLLISLAAFAASWWTHGWQYTAFHITGMVALAYWSYLEITDGASHVRRVLGWIVLAFDAFLVARAAFY